uniref:Conotoxin Gla-TxXI n=1 Tax=Conus textile TaxID=6494 RepID=I2B_CONTE|nr:RecName: Full=Conotoxin Gla-TxXI; Flags: Precursor [Conus textile]AAW50950.1 conotoxin Gla-TxXI precursor [Conus textile]
MVRVTSVGCFLLVIVSLNLVVLTNACIPEGSSCSSSGSCCHKSCCRWTCNQPCLIPGKRAKLLEFFRQR